jgi:hypothetical protein
MAQGAEASLRPQLINICSTLPHRQSLAGRSLRPLRRSGAQIGLAGSDENAVVPHHVSNVAIGRSLCENSSAFSHGPILFAFSSPQTAWNRKNRENFRSA